MCVSRGSVWLSVRGSVWLSVRVCGAEVLLCSSRNLQSKTSAPEDL